jgi:hypothetical protein
LFDRLYLTRFKYIGRGNWGKVTDILFVQERLTDRIQTMDRTHWLGDPIAVAIRAARLLKLGHAPSLIVQNSLPAPAAVRGINRNLGRTKIVVLRHFTCCFDGRLWLVGHGTFGGHH